MSTDFSNFSYIPAFGNREVFRNRKKIIPLAAALVVSVLCGSEAVQGAQDGKFYPGTFCRVTEETHDNSNALRYGKFGFAVNNSRNVRLRVTCPIIRDEMNTNRGVEVKVFYHDSHPNQSLACELLEIDVMANRSHRIDRFEVEEFIAVNVGLGKICNKELVEDFPSHFSSGHCFRILNTANYESWSGSTPGSGLVLHCGLPPVSTNDDFATHNPSLTGAHARTGRSGIAGYYVVETTQ